MKKSVVISICLCAIVFFGMIAYMFCLFVGGTNPVGRPGMREHSSNIYGMELLSNTLKRKAQAEPSIMNSFTQFFYTVKSERPETVGDINDANPFRGILPRDHTYARFLDVPNGLSACDVPLIWDTKQGPDGWVAVLFWDGNVPESFDAKQLDKMVENVKQHGGRVSLGANK